MNILVKDQTEIKMNYISIVVYEKDTRTGNQLIIYSSPKFVDSPYNQTELGKLIQPFVMENIVKKRFVIMQIQISETIKYTHL